MTTKWVAGVVIGMMTLPFPGAATAKKFPLTADKSVPAARGQVDEPRCPRFPQEPLRPVMNRTACDAAGRALFVTGNLSSIVLEIRVRLQSCSLLQLW